MEWVFISKRNISARKLEVYGSLAQEQAQS